MRHPVLYSVSTSVDAAVSLRVCVYLKRRLVADNELHAVPNSQKTCSWWTKRTTPTSRSPTLASPRSTTLLRRCSRRSAARQDVRILLLFLVLVLVLTFMLIFLSKMTGRLKDAYDVQTRPSTTGLYSCLLLCTTTYETTAPGFPCFLRVLWPAPRNGNVLQQC